MLLAIDLGNTQTAIGLFNGSELVQSWRMPTDHTFTKDELHVRLLGYFQMYGISLAQVSALAFAGVVPQLLREWRGVAVQLGVPFVQVGSDTAAVTKVDAPHPAEVGADRIANAIAARNAYGSRAAKLASVPMEVPAHAIGRNTVEAVQVGIVMGTAAMAEGLVGRIRRELGETGRNAQVIATGGLAGVVANCTEVFDHVDQQLTLQGIRLIWERMQE